MGELQIFGKLNVVVTVNESQTRHATHHYQNMQQVHHCECRRQWSLPATDEQLRQQGWDCEVVDAEDPTVLGEGGSSVVFKRELRICPPECTIRTPMVCAVKRLTGGLAGTVKTTLRMAREAQVMVALDNFTKMHNSARGSTPPEYQYILPFYGSYLQDHVIYIAMQYMEHGDLEHYISEPWDENDVRVVTEQLLWGLKFMHENNIAHRDIKPANIFPSFTVDGSLFIKIGDFGSAKSTDIHGAELSTIIGTHDYMAPEVYGKRDRPYTVKVDSWSVGCMVYRLLSGKDLFMSYMDTCRYCPETHPTLIKDGLPGSSAAAIQFLKRLIQPEAEYRASPQEALDHRWLRYENPRGFGNRIITPNLAKAARGIIQAGIKPRQCL